MADTTKILQGDPIRVIREQWHGPQGAQRLSEELYTMFSGSKPTQTDTPTTLNQSSSDTPALTINNTYGGVTINIQGGDIIYGGGGDITFNPPGAPAGNITIGGDQIQFNPQDPSNILIGNVPLPDYIIDVVGTGGGGGGELGQVMSGSGSSYTVALYGNGISQAATDTVTATVPQISVGETVPTGTYVTVVHAGTEYNFQPPVWM